MTICIRRGWRAAVVFGLYSLIWFAGCHRRTMPPPLPAVVQAPIIAPPSPPAPDMPSPPPEGIATAPAVRVTEKTPRRRPRKNVGKATAVVVPTPPAPEIATVVAPQPAPTPESSPLGALSTGTDSNPKTQQDLAELINATERRINGLSASAATQQQTQVREIRRFIDQARQVLKTGDAEGARTLATKARLLMDDLEKWAQKS